MTVSAYYQFEWGVNGYQIGAGKPVQVLSIEGLEDAPMIRTQDTTRGYADGMFTGRDFYQGRTIVLHLQVLADANGSMSANFAALKKALQPQRAGLNRLTFWIPNQETTNGTQYVFARVRRFHTVIDPNFVYGRGEALVEFFCPDPRIYSGGQIIGLSATSLLARTYARTYPRTYSTATSTPTSASVVLTNNGTYETSAKITVVGAAVNPVVTLVQAGGVNATWSFTCNLVDGDNLVIYTDSKAITLNGSPARNLLNTGSTWANVPVGSSTLTVRFPSASANSFAYVQYANAYL